MTENTMIKIYVDSALSDLVDYETDPKSLFESLVVEVNSCEREGISEELRSFGDSEM